MDFFENLKTQKHIDLNPAQKEAVLHKNGPCLVLAVPGSGKTTTLLTRCAYLIEEHNVNPQNILSITFSRQSANDMKLRFRSLFGHLSSNVIFSTIHALSFKIVNRFYPDLSLIEGSTNIKLTKAKLIKEIYKSINKKFLSDSDFDTLNNEISYVTNMMYSSLELENFRSEFQNFPLIYNTYFNYKSEHNLIDFDDMLVKCYQILNDNPNVLKAYNKRFKFIQVDEAQDTSILQHEIINLLSSSNNNILYVADDDQSIYGFRAAFPKYLLNINKIYPDINIIKMELNYRSSKNIVNLSNSFIKANKNRYPKNITTDKDKGEAIKIFKLSNHEKQYNQCIKEIIKLNDFNNTAVLFRNRDSAFSLILNLYNKSIEFQLKGFKNNYFKHWTIQNIINILKFSENNFDIDSYSKFYYTLKGYYISKLLVEYVKRSPYAYKKNVFDIMLTKENLSKYQYAKILELKMDIRRLSTLAPYKAINFILNNLSYKEYLIEYSRSNELMLDSYLTKIKTLQELARNCSNVNELINKITLLENIIKESQSNTNSITLSTMHSSKGLEWDNVMIIDLIEGVIPSNSIYKTTTYFSSIKKSDNFEALEEERRLLYVAMTRAKKRLFLFNIDNDDTSRFLTELLNILNNKK